MHAGEQLHTCAVIVVGGERRRDPAGWYRRRSHQTTEALVEQLLRPSRNIGPPRPARTEERRRPTNDRPPTRDDGEPQPAEARHAQSPRLGTVPALSTGFRPPPVSTGQHRPEPRSRSNLDAPAHHRLIQPLLAPPHPAVCGAASKLQTAPGGVRPVRPFDALDVRHPAAHVHAL